MNEITIVAWNWTENNKHDNIRSKQGSADTLAGVFIIST